MPSASAPISTCTNPEKRTGSAMRSMRFLIHSPPSARPVMKADSISSKAWNEEPSTSESMRTQAIS